MHMVCRNFGGKGAKGKGRGADAKGKNVATGDVDGKGNTGKSANVDVRPLSSRWYRML